MIDKKDLEFYKEAEKTDKSIKVCEVNEEDFLYLNFDTNNKHKVLRTHFCKNVIHL